MGLDMYLMRRTNVQNWDFNKDKEHYQCNAKLNGKKHPVINPRKISMIEEEIGYWRKANHIHNWFIQNVADGKDKCQEIWLTEENIKDLLDTCKKVIASPDLAEEILPTASGFFFGGTEYDEWYIQSTKDTIPILEDALNSLEISKREKLHSVSIIYQASW